jgi:glutathione S-transferase
MREGVTAPRLITIPISHYCEKARWALDRARIAYREDGHAPVLHWRATMPNKTRTVPVLITDGAILKSSSEILRWCDARTTDGAHLYPTDPAERREVEELEAHFDAKLGPATRRWAYSYLLPDRRRSLEVLTTGIPEGEARAFTKTFTAIAALIKRGMGVNEAGALRSRERIHAIFAEVSGRLSDGRKYLVGNRFTAADLTFGALSIPAVAPPQYHWLPLFDTLPAAMRAEIEAWRATPAGRFALRLYREERPRAARAA